MIGLGLIFLSTYVSLDDSLQEEIPLHLRSSPDSSTDHWHNIHVVTPQSPNKTRCPVCRQHVADLSHHFALEHG